MHPVLRRRGKGHFECRCCMARFCAGILPWQKADLADPHFSEFVLWRRKRTSKVRQRMRTRGFQCFTLNGNQTENDRYWQKNMGNQKSRILCWFQIRWCRLKQMPLKKAIPKNYSNFEYFRFCSFFCGFLLLTFIRGIFESRHRQNINQLKILRFLCPYWY